MVHGSPKIGQPHSTPYADPAPLHVLESLGMTKKRSLKSWHVSINWPSPYTSITLFGFVMLDPSKQRVQGSSKTPNHEVPVESPHLYKDRIGVVTKPSAENIGQSQHGFALLRMVNCPMPIICVNAMVFSN